MSELLLFGVSGLSREVLNVLRLSREHRVLGVLDDNESNVGNAVDGVPVLGGLEVLERQARALLVICVGQGSARARVASRLSRAGFADARYARIVHPSVVVPRNCTVGAGSILLAGTVLTADVMVGRHVVVMPNVVLTHGDHVASFATLSAGVTLGGGVRIGEEATVGMNASVRERVRVGRRAVLGMGAALLRDLPAGETWVGVPAAPSRQHEPKLQVRR